MNRKKVLHIVLTVVGTGALMAYLIACSPAWSPDGSQVLFPYVDVDAGGIPGIAMYDRNTGKTTPIFSHSGTVPPVVVRAQWDSTGKKVIVISASGRDYADLHVQVLRIGAKEPDHTFVVPRAGVRRFPGSPLGGMPLLEAEGSLFTCEGSLFTRMDLRTGAVKQRKMPGVVGPMFLVGNGNQIYYVAMPKQEYHIGTLDPKKLSFSRTLKLQKNDVGELLPHLVAVTKDGSTIAILAKMKVHLLLIADGRIQKSIPLMPVPKDGVPVNLLGGFPHNLQWAPDGKTIYVGVVSEERQPPLKHFFVEITVDTGAMRRTPIVTPKQQGHGSTLMIDLSPDGKTIAAISMCPVGDNTVDLTTHLVDLTDPDRKVIKIRPPKPAPKPARAQQNPKN